MTYCGKHTTAPSLSPGVVYTAEEKFTVYNVQADM